MLGGFLLFLVIVLCKELGCIFCDESNNILQFEWTDYGNDSTFMGNPIASGRDNEFFQSLRQHIENQRVIKGKISIPSILGLNVYEMQCIFVVLFLIYMVACSYHQKKLIMLLRK
jgi:hypothetical protein